MEIIPFFQTFLGNYITDPKWYPYIFIAAGIIFLVIVYIIFMYIRSFVSWIFGVNEVILLQKENNRLLRQIAAIQEEQREILESLFVDDSQNNAENSDNLENRENAESEKNTENSCKKA